MRQVDESGVTDLRAASTAARVSAFVATHPDPATRIAWLGSEGLPSDPPRLAATLEALAEGADAGLDRYRRALHESSVALAADARLGLRKAAASYAISAALDRARELLVPDTSRPEMSDARVPDLAMARPVTLGERKSLARLRDRGRLERLMRDPHPDVASILLGNPALREIDVQRWAALRPVHEAVLRALYVHPRWFVRYGVRLALVQNPYLPSDLGCALVRTLLSQDAHAITVALELPEAVRRRAADLTRPGRRDP